MKMAIWSPLTTHWAVNLVDSSPRTSKTDTIIHHHVAGTNKLAALAIFAPGGREATPNYFIVGREIWGIVPEDRRAWTSGSAFDDQRAITYEILNLTGGPNWGFDPVTLDTVARLDADIAKRYGVPLRHAQPGFMEHRNIYEWFRRGYATACAGPSFHINQIISATAVKMNTAPATPEEEEEEMNIGMYRKVGAIYHVIIGNLASGFKFKYQTGSPAYNNTKADQFKTGSFTQEDQSVIDRFEQALDAVRQGI